MKYSIRRLTPDDRPWVNEILRKYWGSSRIVSRGRLYYADRLPGFIAADGNEKLGLLTYSVDGNECEITTLNSLAENQGIGTALLEAVISKARHTGCKRIHLITTNDNLNALRFYQKRGFVLVAVHRNAMQVSRGLKPEIPLTGNHSIPIRDEIELEMIIERGTR
jgi:GNAT superfamily N-acetyltransferase